MRWTRAAKLNHDVKPKPMQSRACVRPSYQVLSLSQPKSSTFSLSQQLDSCGSSAHGLFRRHLAVDWFPKPIFITAFLGGKKLAAVSMEACWASETPRWHRYRSRGIRRGLAERSGPCHAHL